MARKAKTAKYGYSLRVKLNRDGVEVFERVGFLFNSKKEAKEYKDEHFPNADGFAIQGIRVNTEQVKAPSAHDERTA